LPAIEEVAFDDMRTSSTGSIRRPSGERCAPSGQDGRGAFWLAAGGFGKVHAAEEGLEAGVGAERLTAALHSE